MFPAFSVVFYYTTTLNNIVNNLYIYIHNFLLGSRDSSVGIAMGFDSREGQEIFPFSTASVPALGPTQPPIQWVPKALYQGIKRMRREADQSHPSSAEVKNGGAIPPLSHTYSWHRA
jgi:hypothetical protein